MLINVNYFRRKITVIAERHSLPVRIGRTGNHRSVIHHCYSCSTTQYPKNEQLCILDIRSKLRLASRNKIIFFFLSYRVYSTVLISFFLSYLILSYLILSYLIKKKEERRKRKKERKRTNEPKTYRFRSCLKKGRVQSTVVY